MKNKIEWNKIDDSYILTNREVCGIKLILSVSRDAEMKKLLTDRLIKHNFAKEIKNIIRRGRLLRYKILGHPQKINGENVVSRP